MAKSFSFVFLLWLMLLHTYGAFRMRSSQRRHSGREGGAVRVRTTQKHVDHGEDIIALKKALPSLQPPKDSTSFAAGSFLESFGANLNTSAGDWTRVGKDILQNGKVKYRLGKVLGEGTYGEVFEGTNYEEKSFAVKFIAKEKIANPHDYDAIINEVTNLKKVHVNPTEGRADPIPSVVRLYDDFTIDDGGGEDMYIVMDNGGSDLFDYIVEVKQIPVKIAKSIFKQVIGGLDACHSRHVVHRDLKPENILYDASKPYDEVAGTATIIDFGFSADTADGKEVMESLKQEPPREDKLLTMQCGSPNYAAPELLTAPVMYNGPPVDIWAMGCILYAMLCGSLPFDDEEVNELFEAIRSGRHHPFCSSMRRDARDLVSKMLNIDPEKRITIPKINEHPFVKT